MPSSPQRSRAIAGGLAGLGVRRGDRVVVYLQNRIEVVEVALACSRLGAMFVPANPLLKARQLRHILADSGAAALVFSALRRAPPSRHARHSQLRPCSSRATPRRRSMPGRATSRVRSAGESRRRAGARARRSITMRSQFSTPPAARGRRRASWSRIAMSSRARSPCRAISAMFPTTACCAALPLSFDYGFSQVTTAFTVGACAVLTNFSTAAALMQEIGGGADHRARRCADDVGASRRERVARRGRATRCATSPIPAAH